MFQMFEQNEKVFRDQHLIMEAQQSARAVIMQIGDEIRMAGQGVPVYASTFDAVPSEAVAVILPGSDRSRINFRAGLSNAETPADGATAMEFQIGVAHTVKALDTSFFVRGRFVYIWGQTSDLAWTWVRAELTGISNSLKTLTVVPRESGHSARIGAHATVTQEETVSFYIDGGSIKRAAGSAGSEIGRHFSTLAFKYLDRAGEALTPDTMGARFSIVRVDVQVVVRTAEPLANGTRPSYELSMSITPRNLKIR